VNQNVPKENRAKKDKKITHSKVKKSSLNKKEIASALHKAILEGNIDEINNLITQMENVNELYIADDGLGIPFIFFARNQLTFDCLLEHGVNPYQLTINTLESLDERHNNI